MSSEGTFADQVRGTVRAEGLRVAIVVARFNSEITERLVRGALECMEEHGAEPDSVEVHWVPGAWELPQAAARISASARHDAIVTLGCVIRGETPHFEYVCAEANRGLGAVARQASMPLVFGVLTTNDRAQALARAGEGRDNKGYEACLAALQMVSLFRALDDRG